MLDTATLRALILNTPTLAALQSDPPALVAALNTAVVVPIRKPMPMDPDELVGYLSQNTAAALSSAQTTEDPPRSLMDKLRDDATNQRYGDVRGLFDTMFSAGVLLEGEYATLVGYITRPRHITQTPIESAFGVQSDPATLEDVNAALAAT